MQRWCQEKRLQHQVSRIACSQRCTRYPLLPCSQRYRHPTPSAPRDSVPSTQSPPALPCQHSRAASPRLLPLARSSLTTTQKDGPVLTATTVAVPVPVPAGPAGVFHDHTLPAQILAVQLVNGIVGVSGVLELHEAVTGGRSKAPSAARPRFPGQGGPRRPSRDNRSQPRRSAPAPPRAAAILSPAPRGSAGGSGRRHGGGRGGGKRAAGAARPTPGTAKGGRGASAGRWRPLGRGTALTRF